MQKCDIVGCMVEREGNASDENNPADIPFVLRSTDHVIPNVADPQTLFPAFGELSAQTIPTIQTIRDQFHDTPIATICDDFPESAEITPEQLHTRISRYLCSALQQVDVYEAGAARRTAAIYGAGTGYAYTYGFELYDEFEADEDIDEPALAYARPIWDIMAHLEPAIAADDDEIVMHFTPVVKSEDQLILYEHREHKMYVNPAVSTHFLTVEEDQYRIFICDEHSGWQQQSVLPFFIVSVYRDSPAKLTNQKLGNLIEEAQDISEVLLALQQEIEDRYEPDEDTVEKRVLKQRLQALEQWHEKLDFLIQICDEAPLQRYIFKLDKPYPSDLFNGIEETTYQGMEVHGALARRDIFAALPEVLNIPPAPDD